MPKDAADRPSRRLGAILAALREYGVSEWSGPIPGVTETPISIKFTTRNYQQSNELTQRGGRDTVIPPPVSRYGRRDDRPPPRDELATVLELADAGAIPETDEEAAA